MEEILELARKLGAALYNDSRFRALREAENRVAADPEARRLLEEFQAQSRKIMELEARQAPIEPEDKRRLRELHDKVAAHPLIKELTKARVEYAALMKQLNEAIFGPSSEE